MRSRMLGVVERVGVDRLGQVDHGVEVGPHADGEAGGADPLGAERAHGDEPALALAAEPVVDRHAGVVEEDLAEHLLAGDVADRADVDARRLEVDDERGDAVVLATLGDGGRVGAHEEQAPLGDVRARRSRSSAR